MKTRLPLSLLALVLSAGFFAVTVIAVPLPEDIGNTITFRTTTIYQLTEDFSYTKNISFVENSNTMGNKQLKFTSDGSGSYSLSFAVPLSSAGGNSGAYIRGNDMSLIFDAGVADVLFSHGRGFKDAGGQAVGGAVFLEMHSQFSFSNQGNVNFYNNSAVSSNNSVYGGAIYLGPFANGISSFTNTGDVNFIGNAAMGTYATGSSSSGGSLGGIFAAGGAITVQGAADPGVGDLIFENAGAVRFLDNKSTLSSVSDDSSGYATVYGGAIHVYSDSAVIFRNTGAVQFVNNSTSLNVFSSEGASASGGAIEIGYSPELLFENTGGVVFVGNSASAENGMGEDTVASGGAIQSTRSDVIFRNMPEEDIVFLKNEVSAKGRSGDTTAAGAAIVGIASSVTFSQVGDIHFKNNTASSLTLGEEGAESNTAEALGGAMYLDSSSLEFMDTGDVYFMDNSAVSGSDLGESMARGGAIYASNSTLVLNTGDGDIVFRGNTVSSDDGSTFTSNAIHFHETKKGTNKLIVNAGSGNSVIFYDPVTSDGKDSSKLVFSFNEEEGADGVILFSGKYASSSSPDSLVSDVSAEIALNGGTLVLEEGVTLGRRASADDTGTSYTQGAATLDITNSTLRAAVITFSGRESVVKPGAGARFEADKVDLSKGVTVDLGYHLNGAEFVPQSGVAVQGSTFVIGGVIGVVDGTLDFYSDNKWASSHEFALFDVSSVPGEGITDTVEGVHSKTTDTSQVTSPYAYQGEWSYVVRDGVRYAVWNPALNENGEPEGILEVLPELAGGMVSNSLWSSASNVSAFTRAGQAQTGAWRFAVNRDVNYWASGLGDFNGHRSRGARDGYDYRGGGYAVGADTLVGKEAVLGVAFGQIFGTSRSRSFSAKDKQDTLMGMLYGEYRHVVNNDNALSVSGTAAYGSTSNKLQTAYSDGESSHGKWDNDTWYLTLRTSWDMNLGDNWTLAPFVGLEYTAGRQDAFTEDGDKARHFDKGKLDNLALPVGIGVSKLADYGNGMKWINSLSVSYVPDVYRNNPEPRATRLLNGFSWDAQGARFDRNAARVELDSRLILNETWSLFGGYSVEGRKDAVYHNVNLGVSASF